MAEEELTLDILEPYEGNPIDDEEIIGGVSTGSSDTDDEPNPNDPPAGDVDKDKGQKPPDGKTPYTPEEITNLLNDGDLTKIDTSRLTPEGQLVMKAIQRGLTPKLEAAAEERRRIEAEKVELEKERQKANDPKEILYRKYVADPNTVTQQINAEIKKLARVSPQSEDFAEAQSAILDLQAYKEELFNRKQTESEQARNLSVTQEKVKLAILQEIPDFMEKRDKLTEFALAMGFGIEEVSYMSDPSCVGNLAFKFTKVLNDLHTKANAGQSADKKEKKLTPDPLARGGTSKEKPSDTTNDPANMTNAQYRAWRKRQGGAI